jgi:hypothetical protein
VHGPGKLFVEYDDGEAGDADYPDDGFELLVPSSEAGTK